MSKLAKPPLKSIVEAPSHAINGIRSVSGSTITGVVAKA